MSLKVIASVALVLGNYIQAAERLPVARAGDVKQNLVTFAREHPDSLRDALSGALAALISSSDEAGRESQLRRAQQLAAAYASAWSDAFFVREVKSFAASSPSQQAVRVRVDSLRRAGIMAMTRDGIPLAMKLWRESLRLASSLRDPAVDAAPLLAVGAGFYRQGELDSASAYLEKARDHAARAGDVRTNGNAVGILASVAKDRGDLSGARKLYARASAIRARSGDTRGIAADYNNLGVIALALGDLAGATRAYESALAINRRDARPGQQALNLSNLAAVASRNSEYSRADSLYRLAIGTYGVSGDRAETGFVLHDLGRLQIRRGDYAGARSTLSAALNIHEESGAAFDAIEVRADLAAVESATGDVEGALTTLRDAERKAVMARAPPEVTANLALARGDLAVQFGTFADADAEYARAAKLFFAAGDEAGRAEAEEGRAVLLHLRGDNAAAFQLLRQVTRVESAHTDRRMGALTQLTLAAIQASSGSVDSAAATLSRARQDLHASRDAVGEAAAFSALSEIALAKGENARAQQLSERGLVVLGARAAADVRWRLHTDRGEALRARGQLQSSASEFRRAIAISERAAQGVRLDERRAGFLADKSSAYTSLALVEEARGHVAAAFDASERLRARQMLSLLARGRVRGLHAASTEEQDLRRRIAELTHELETGQPYRLASREPVPAHRSAEATRAELDAAQRAYERLMLRVREDDPAYARLVSDRTRGWREIASHLKTDEVLLEYLVTDSASSVFVVSRDTIVALDLHVTRQALADLVEFARGTMDHGSSRGAGEPWRIPLHRLYRYLIDPIARAGYLRGKRALIVAPHGELHFLPFGPLVADDGRFLIQNFQIAFTPSATTWLELGERHLPPAGGNVLALAPQTARLAGSLEEVQAIRRIYGSRATVRTGRAASERSLRGNLRDFGTVHLATLGILNKHNPLFSFIELAPEGADDGHLEVNEVFGLGLTGQRIILSACQTGLASGATADVPAGDDWVGLVQAFLQAGASNVVAALWPVDDRATARLMEQFHRGIAAGHPTETALADAQRALIGQANLRSPFFWAAFVVTGGSTSY